MQTIGVRIVSGHYQPGDPILAEALEADLGVSKTVVREALKVLAAKGLVESRPKRGTVVRPRDAWSLLDPDLLLWQSLGTPQPAFLQDLAEVRSIVEPEGARLAAQRRLDSDLEAIDSALDAMTHADGDADRVIEADLLFHRSLLDAAHNELLSRMEGVIEAGLRIRDQMVHGAGRGADAVAAHQAIADAVRDGDSERAEVATRALLARAEEDTRR